MVRSAPLLFESAPSVPVYVLEESRGRLALLYDYSHRGGGPRVERVCPHLPLVADVDTNPVGSADSP